MPKAKGRKQVAEIEEPSKAWLDSFADAMTLLLTFFILLYAMSFTDEQKFEEFKGGVAGALGLPSPVLEGGNGILDRGNGVATLVAAPPTVEQNGAGENEGKDDEEGDSESGTAEDEELGGIEEVTPENAEEVVEALRQEIERIGAAEFVEVVNDPRGVIIRFDSQILFRSGEAKILPDGVIVLQSVSGALAALDNPLVVEGHTDNVPTSGTEWPTNWELSVNRATTVLRYLTDLENIAPARISAAGYADTRPRASNRTPEGRAENRRVEVLIVVAPYNEQLFGGDAEGADGAPAPRTGDAAIEDPVGRPTEPGNILEPDPASVEPAG